MYMVNNNDVCKKYLFNNGNRHVNFEEVNRFVFMAKDSRDRKYQFELDLLTKYNYENK